MKSFPHKKAKAPVVYVTTLCAEKGWYGPYTLLVQADGKQTCFSNKTIHEWESELPFVRTDQSHLVNPDFVERLERNPNRTGSLWIKGGDTIIPVSRRFFQTVRKSLNPSLN